MRLSAFRDGALVVMAPMTLALCGCLPSAAPAPAPVPVAVAPPKVEERTVTPRAAWEWEWTAQDLLEVNPKVVPLAEFSALRDNGDYEGTVLGKPVEMTGYIGRISVNRGDGMYNPVYRGKYIAEALLMAPKDEAKPFDDNNRHPSIGVRANFSEFLWKKASLNDKVTIRGIAGRLGVVEQATIVHTDGTPSVEYEAAALVAEAAKDPNGFLDRRRLQPFIVHARVVSVTKRDDFEVVVEGQGGANATLCFDDSFDSSKAFLAGVTPGSRISVIGTMWPGLGSDPFSLRDCHGFVDSPAQPPRK